MKLGILELTIVIASLLAITPLLFRLVRTLTFKALSVVIPYEIEVEYRAADGSIVKDKVSSAKLRQYLLQHQKLDPAKVKRTANE